MFFQRFWPHFQKGYDLEEIFCELVISVVNPSIAVSVFYIVCDLETLCELQSSISYNKNYDNTLEETSATYCVLLHR